MKTYVCRLNNARVGLRLSSVSSPMTANKTQPATTTPEKIFDIVTGKITLVINFLILAVFKHIICQDNNQYPKLQKLFVLYPGPGESD
jgi:hypothetical protein